MPDGRFLSKSIANSEQLNSVSLEAAFLFTWLIPHLDVEGRMVGNSVSVKATAAPLRRDLPVERVPELLLELARARRDDRGRPLIYWYEVSGRRFLEFPGFRDHNRGIRVDREAKSRLPNHRHPQAIDLTTVYPATPGGGPGATPGASPDPVPETLPEEVPLSEVKEYVSTPKISDRGERPAVPAGSAAGAAPPAERPVYRDEPTTQEILERKERFKAGLREAKAGVAKP